MQETLDESVLIDRIRQCGDDIFDDHDRSISYSLSDSENNLQERLKPFIKQARPSKKHSRTQGLTHYISPYSQRKNNQNDHSYRGQCSRRSDNAAVGIRRKIFSLYNEQKKIEEQKQQARPKSKTPNKMYTEAKPKYLQKQPIVPNLSGYIQKNVYGRMKTEAEHSRKPSRLSNDQSEQKWESFLERSNMWEQQRENSIVRARIQQNMKVKQDIEARPVIKTPPKMTVDDCIQKLRRHAEKLKEKLNNYTFSPVIYQTERKQKIAITQKKTEAKDTKNYRDKTQREYTTIRNPQKQLNFIFT